MAAKKKMSYKEALEFVANDMAEVFVCPPARADLECKVGNNCRQCWRKWRTENVQEESVTDCHELEG